MNTAVRLLSPYARAATLAAHFFLLAGLLWWSTTNLGRLTAALLLLPLPGLLRGREYTYAWASLMLSIYCAGLLAEGVAVPAHRPASMGFALLAALDFCGMLLYVRWRARERRATAAGTA